MKGTLHCQGGPMTDEEAAIFENRPDFQVFVLFLKC
jgi:hypothetical protein